METFTPDSKDTRHKVTRQEAEAAIRCLIRYVGENPDREGLAGTPGRILEMWNEIFRGYNEECKPKITTFSNSEHTSGMIFDTGSYYSMCEHHILPFFGRYYFAYIPKPDGRILGISKVARVVGYCAARMQLQERLAKDIVDMLTDALGGYVEGMAIVMRGTHLCKSMRGVKNQGQMSVVYVTGAFADTHVKQEFYEMIRLQQE